nr:carbohydrate-binding family 9-like protein [Desulfobulbaceae bacterium]
MRCKATRQENCSITNATWNTFPWEHIPSEQIQNYMGKRPDHFPKVAVKIAYDSTAVAIMFRVEDRYVRARAVAHQGNVYEDSCVEFFFTPGPDISKGYFNLEMNCGGTMLFHFQRQPRKDRVVIPVSECETISCLHSLPRIVDPEIKTPVIWIVAYRIPITVLEKYCQVISPAPQAVWRANFYKCADSSSHPHWLTWAPVDLPTPNFHYPQAFGRLQFE